MTKQKNQAAVALGKKRWKGKTKKEIKEAMEKVRQSRTSKVIHKASDLFY